MCARGGLFETWMPSNQWWVVIFASNHKTIEKLCHLPMRLNLCGNERRLVRNDGHYSKTRHPPKTSRITLWIGAHHLGDHSHTTNNTAVRFIYETCVCGCGTQIWLMKNICFVGETFGAARFVRSHQRLLNRTRMLSMRIRKQKKTNTSYVPPDDLRAWL